MTNEPKKRVAIIGGGYAAISAAWDLTAPENEQKCEVTIFQMGGRLGGKGASSRNKDRGYRIEEHGLHLWLGYYENAFRMIRTCYSELSNLGPVNDDELDSALATAPFGNWDWRKAFDRARQVGLADDSTGDWLPWIARFPEYVHKDEDGYRGVYRDENGMPLPGIHIVDDPRLAYPGEEQAAVLPGEVGEDEAINERVDVAFFLTQALRDLQTFAESLEIRLGELAGGGGVVTISDDSEELLMGALQAEPDATHLQAETRPVDVLQALRIIRLTLLVPAIQAFSTTARLADSQLPFVRNRFVHVLDQYIDAMREKVEMIVTGDTPARRLWELIDILAANIRGLVVSGLEGEDDFSALDEYSYAGWLRENGLAERTLRNPLLRGAYDLSLAYRDGNPRAPELAAGQALQAACRFFFTYKGALFWRMNAGMGEVVFAPMYLALRNRGVKFRFFHRLDDIELSGDYQSVTRLRFRRQVRLVTTDVEAPTNYRPLIIVPGPMPAWPVAPHVSQFDYDDRTKQELCDLIAQDPTSLDFESIWCDWPHADEVFATVGDARPPRQDPAWIGHYDDVIATVPIAALPRVSQQLAKAPTAAGRRWQAMLDNVATVATQCVQLWVHEPTDELGWAYGQISLSAFVHPFDTWADFSHLTAVERQPDARGIHYFCSVLPEAQLPPKLRAQGPGGVLSLRAGLATSDVIGARAIVKENARRFLNDWIFQLWPLASGRYPNVFDWKLLVADAGRRGAERLNDQHLVANVEPSQRYTQSLPGTIKYRIRPDDTRFGHLFIAGDWTDCDLNLGCVEAAVMSGRLASRALTGFPPIGSIPGHTRRPERIAATEGGH